MAPAPRSPDRSSCHPGGGGPGGVRHRLPLAFALLLAPWIPAVVVAAPPSPASAEPAFIRTSWSVQDGLPVNSLTDLTQTRDGYLWIATFDGLVRFDGLRFTVFDQSNTPDLPSNRILSLHEGDDGSLWIKTQSSGVVHMTDPVGGWSVFDGGESPEIIHTLSMDAAGTPWVGTDFGLSRPDGRRIVPIQRERLRTSVDGLYRDRSGTFWTYSYPKMSVLSDSAFTTFQVEPEGPGRLRGFYELDDGRVLIGGPNGLFETSGDRLRAVDWTSLGDDRRIVGSEESSRHGPITVPLLRFLYQPSADGSIRAAGTTRWATAEGRAPVCAQGALLYEDDRLIADLGSAVTAVLIDYEGSVWVGTSDAGLCRVTRGVLTTRVPDIGGHKVNVTGLFEARDGAIWVASFGRGVGVLRGEQVDGFRAGGSDVLTQGVIERSDGQMLVAGWAGLFEYRNGDLHPFARSRITQDHEVYLLHEDQGGWLWIGTQLGVFRTRGDEWHAYGVADGLGSPWVRSAVERRHGELWFGTNGGGIAIWRNGRFEALQSGQGLPARAVRGMYEDANGVVWVATEGLGLARIELPEGRPVAEARVTMIRQKDGLYEDMLHAVLEDDAGFLWISTNRGLFRARRSALDAFAAGGTERVFCTSFTEADGMRNRECNGQVHRSAIRSRDGRLWFATQEGVVVVDPALAHRALPAPPVAIEEMRAKTLRFSGRAGSVRLPAEDRDFTIEYSGISLRTPGDLRFRYRLDGLDQGWNEVGGRRTAIYTHVPPGAYTFEVAGSLPDDDWSGDVARMTIVVAPFFYETWWFRALLAALALAALYAGMRLRVRGLVRRQRELAAEVTARTRDLTGQQAQTERARAEAEDARDAAQRSLDTIEVQARELRELNEARSRFFANVSHEFRTPLTLTIGPIEDLLAGLHGPLREDAAEQLHLALRSSNRVLRQVNQLLDLARAESGGMQLKARRIDPAALVDEVIAAFAAAATRNGVTLSADPGDAGPEVWADPVMLEQVVANLVSNAIRHTPHGGRVSVSIRFDGQALAASRVRIIVTDTGDGIAEADRERIFERFYQAESAARRGFPSTGIGLSLTRDILEVHGGGIDMESAPGEGSTFTAWLPTGRAHLAEGQIASDDDAPLPALAPWLLADVAGADANGSARAVNGKDAGPAATDGVVTEDVTTVLVVEDDPEVRAYLRRHLGASYRVVDAEDGEAGVAAVRSEMPDLVVSDVMMPRMDGLELCAAIKRDPETEFVPVILLTAKAAVEHRIEGLEQGADDYLAKPFHARELIARVRNLIASRRQLRDRLAATRAEVAARAIHAAPVEAAAADAVFLERVRATVEVRLGEEDFGVQELARTIGLDRTNLFRRLQSLTGEGPGDLIRRFRLERAAQLLEARAGAVGEIAYAVGFKGVAHFCKCFRDRYGKSPGAWVKERVPGA